MRLTKMLLAGAAALAITAGAAQAQNYNRILSFGDSLSDNGNLFATTGQPPFPYNQRFTNELVWSEYLFGAARGFTTTNPGNINTGNINFAFGGARTDLLPNSNGPIPSTGTQLGAFLLQGGLFGANDIVSLWGGANNLFQGIPVAAATPATAVATMTGIAQASAADIGNQLRLASASGARTALVFNLPDIGLAPSFLGGPAQQLASFSSSAFNTALFAQAQNSGGANVILIPVDQIFAAILGNPTGFGLSNVTQQCLTTPACVGNPAARNSFLFWDGVHPTATGHLLIAASVREYLQTPSRAAAVSGILGNTAFGNRRSSATEALGQIGSLPTQPDAWRWFAYGSGEAGQSGTAAAAGFFGTVPQAGFGTRQDFNQIGLRFGGLRGIGNGWTVGLMGTVMRGDIETSGGRFKADTMQFGADILGRWRSQTGSFVNLGVGAGLDVYSDYEYRTIGPLVNKASTQALSWSAMAEAGHDFTFGQFTATPLARLSYIASTLEAFNEAGVVAPVAFGSRTVGAFGAAAELKLSYAISTGVSAYVLGGYESTFGNSGSDVAGRLIGNTAQPFTWRAEAPRAPGLVAGAGISVNLGTTTARLGYRGTFGEKDTQRHSLNVGIDSRF